MLRALAGSLSAATLFLAIAASAASAAGSAEQGSQLAKQWCSSCHLVDGRSGSDVAPPFRTIAQQHKNDERWTRAWLSSPHPRMPNLNLSRNEIDDIVAYLGSLKKG